MYRASNTDKVLPACEVSYFRTSLSVFQLEVYFFLWGEKREKLLIKDSTNCKYATLNVCSLFEMRDKSAKRKEEI